MESSKSSKKGAAVLVYFMMGILFFMVGLSLSPAISKVVSSNGVMGVSYKYFNGTRQMEYNSQYGSFPSKISNGILLGQTFTTNNASVYKNYTTKSISFEGYREGIINNVTVRFYAVDSSGYPTGGILFSGTKNISSISTNEQTIIIPLSNYNFDNNTKYSVVFSITDDKSVGNLTILIGTNSYLAGNKIDYTGVWSEDLTRDLGFNIKGYETVESKSGLDCSNINITNYYKGVCMSVDVISPIFLAIIFGLAGILISKVLL